MTTVTQDQLQRYINMAQDLNTYRGFREQIKDIQADIQLNGASISPDIKQEWQNQLATYQEALQHYPEKLQRDYRVQNFNDLSKQMRQMEPAITQAYQQQATYAQQVTERQQAGLQPTVDTYLQQQQHYQASQLPKDTLTTAYALMQQEKQQRHDNVGGDLRFQQFAAKNLPDSQQQAQQQSSQPMSDQQLIKNVMTFRELMYKQQQVQQAVDQGRLQMSPEGQAYLQEQRNATMNAWQNFLQEHQQRLVDMPNRAALPPQPALSFDQLSDLARRVDTAGLQQRAAQVEKQRQAQGIEHPEKSEFDRKLEEGTRKYYERKAQEREQRRDRGKGGPEH